MQDVIKIIEALKWPVVVIVVAWIFRKPLSDLIPFLESIKYRDFEARFAKKVKELEKGAKNLPCSIEVIKATHPKGETRFQAQLARFEELAKIDTRSAILAAWRDLEFAIYNKAKASGILEKTNIRKIAERLEVKGILDSGTVKMLKKMRQLRNEAAHAREFDVAFPAAIEYAEISIVLTVSINEKK